MSSFIWAVSHFPNWALAAHQSRKWITISDYIVYNSIQWYKRFNLEPKAAINCTDILILILILIFNEHNFQYNSLHFEVYWYKKLNICIFEYTGCLKKFATIEIELLVFKLCPVLFGSSVILETELWLLIRVEKWITVSDYIV